MKLNKKAGLLTGVVLSVAVAYAPLASASDLGALTLPYANFSLSDSVAVGGGQVSDLWYFSLSSPALLTDAQNSASQTQVLSVPGFGLSDTTLSGVILNSVNLFKGVSIATGTLIASAVIDSSFSVPVVQPIFSGLGTETTTTTSYTSFWNNNPNLNFIYLAAGNYILDVTSTNQGGAVAGYTGTLSVIAAPTTIPVPAPIWLFGSALGMLSLVSRKNKIG